ncbi:PAAR-like protein [Paraburkholderia sp. J10-1]|uniref:PAAR-like protein n=1 Tax=Paraburkholderia sp. J10-1 TaxID=2805430 RepID=UPI002AB7181F|nr:PAAR-like protein [Paraburkholderia sp. J10-1]
MPGFLLHSGALVTCSHLGTAEPMTVSPQVSVSGQPIVTQTSTYGVTACQLPTVSSGAPPCASASWLCGATQVFSNGAPVLLTDSQSVCAPTGTPLIIGLTQFAVKGQ